MKIVVMIQGGTLAGRTYELETGFLTVGRGETCSIRFDPMTERIASKLHAFIEAKPDGFYIRDNQSTNGTYLNGNRIESAKLSHADQIQFGQNGIIATVRVVDEQKQASTPEYRELEQKRFDQAVSHQPVSVQMSLESLALGSMSAAQPEKSKTGRYIGIGLTIFAVIFLALIVILITFASVGPGAAIVAAVVAFIPAMLYLLPFMWLDRYDPEPFWLLALAFAWGALVAVIFSFFANTIFGIGLAIATNPKLGDELSAVIAAPVFEEGSKGLGLIILLIFFRRYFDDILDGIVFAGVIALGFATVENVLYYGRGLLGGGMFGLVFLFLLRGVLSPFAHATFTSVTGIACGIARESHKTAVRVLMPIVGYLGAVSLHALWNGLATYGATWLHKLDLDWLCPYIGMGEGMEGLCAFLISYGVLELPLFVIFAIFALYIMRRQNKILTEMLALDIARGLIPEEHAKKATSAFKSSGWIIGGLFSGKYRARSNYVRALGKLGLSYWHIQRATAAQGHTGSFQQNPILRDEVLKWRDKV